MYRSLIVDKTNSHFKIQLNEPKTKNALSKNMIAELNTLLDVVESDKNIRTMQI